MKTYPKFSDLLGKVLTEVEVKDDEILFKTDSGEVYKQFHAQDCCEAVYVESVVGDIKDLIGTPILLAEEVAYVDENPEGVSEEDLGCYSFTWTFYKLATLKGYVDIRWYGESNGYYSESVDFELLK
jgi:hypothetical protein